jgi:hypothetical protein
VEEAMNEEALRRGAERIVAARAAVTKLDGFADAERPRTIEDGYRMLRIATERWGDAPVGCKVGAQFVADFSGNGAAVLDAPLRDWRGFDLAAQAPQ